MAATTTTRPTEPKPNLAFALPGRNWSVVLDPGELRLQTVEDQLSTDGRARRAHATDPARGVSVSVFLEPAANPAGDARAARDFYLNRLRNSPIPMKDAKVADEFGGSRDFAVLTYAVPDANQKHFNLYASRDGVWVDVHFAIPLDSPGADGAMDALARSARIVVNEKAVR